MATNILEAKITADISELQSGLNKAEKLQDSYTRKIKETQKEIAENIAITKQYENAIENLSKEYKDGVISQKQYQKQLERIQRDSKETSIETERMRKSLSKLKREQKELGALGNSINSVKKNTANATPTLIEFSRVIQDAPFGITGVANNIQQLTTNFGYLRKSAGGTLPALKSLAASFAGPAGMIFAVSTITSLLVSFGDELFSSANKAKKLEDKINNLNDLFQSELDLSKEQEKSLELQGKSTDAILNSRKDLIKAQLKSLKGLIQQQAELLKIQKVQNETTTDWEAFLLILDDAFKYFKKIALVGVQLSKLFAKDLLKGVSELGDSWLKNIVPGIREAGFFADELNKKLEEKKKNNKVSEKDQAKENELQTKLNELLARQVSLENDLLEIDKKRSEKRIQTSTLETSLDSKGIDTSIFDNIGFSFPKEIKLPKINDTDFKSGLDKALETTKIFTDALGSAFSSFGSIITDVLKTGNQVVDAFVGSIINSLTQLLSQFIANQIAMSVLSKTQIAGEQAKANASGIVAATQGSTAFGPAAPFVLPGLIASTAAVINGAFAPLYTFATGGIVPGGSFNGDKVPAFVNSGEMILNNRQQGNLFSALNGRFSALQSNSSTGGFVAETVLRGEDMYILMKRAEKKNNRLGR